jgi:hypothetical protein
MDGADQEKVFFRNLPKHRKSPLNMLQKSDIVRGNVPSYRSIKGQYKGQYNTIISPKTVAQKNTTDRSKNKFFIPFKLGSDSNTSMTSSEQDEIPFGGNEGFPSIRSMP